MILETTAQRAFWAICALLTALLLASPGATQAPDDSGNSGARLADARDDGDDDQESDDEEEGDDSTDSGAAGDDGEPTGGVDQEMLGGAGLDPDIENIIVAGTRSQGMSNVPIAVTQFSSTDIQNLRIQNVADLAAYTPNLEINTSFAASNPTLFIRGIGLKDYNSNSAGAVSIWHDEIQMNSPAAQLFSLFDISSIEVLRGPQGGDRGRNATAGSIRLHSSEPDGDWDSWGSFTYGNYNDLEFEGAIGFPIFPDVFNDTLSGRVAFSAGFRDGYLNNTCADWDPTSHINQSTGVPYPEISKERTIELYNALDPSPVRIPLLNGFPNNGYVFYEADLYEDLVTQGAVGNTTKRLGIHHITNEVVDVYTVNDKFEMDSDGVCVLAPPGNVRTELGEELRPNLGEAGTYSISLPLSLSVEDFQGLKHKLNNIKFWAGRGMLRFQPNDSLDFLFIAHWGQNRGDSFHLQGVGARNFNAPIDPITGEPMLVITTAPGFYNESTGPGFDERDTGFEKVKNKPGLFLGDAQSGLNMEPGTAGADPFNGFYNRDGLEKLDILGFSLRATWELENGRFISITGYEENQRFVQDDGDDCPCGGLGADYTDESWQATQELRLEGEGEDYTWLVSGFAIYEKLKTQNLFFNTLNFLLDQNFRNELTAWNVVAQGHYDFLEEGAHLGFYQLSVDGGIRYNWEQKVFNLNSKARITGSTTSRDSLAPQTASETWHDPTGDITLSYLPIENMTFYAKYTRGMKAGHFNASLTVNADQNGPMQSIEPVAPEYIDSAEVGLKTSLFDDRVTLSASAFRYWYRDLQVFDIVNEVGSIPTQQLLNSDAKVIGFEAELKMQPIEGLTLEGGFGWLDTEFIDFVIRKQTTPGDKNNPGDVTTFHYSGNPLIAAPEFNLSGIAEYEIVTRWGSLIPRYDFSWKSRTYQDPTKQELLSQPAYWLHNARLAYRTPEGKFELAGWVRNFLATTYKVDIFDYTRQFDSVQEIYGEPRTYGFTVSYLW